MRNFFHTSTANWSQRHDKLHVYALPDAAALEYAENFRDALTSFPAISAMPPQNLHFTVQMIERYRHEVDEGRIARLTAALEREAGPLSPVTLSLCAPRVDDTGVTVAGATPAPEFFELVNRVRTAIVEVLGNDSMAPVKPTWGPHMSLGYGIAEGDSAPLIQALSRAAATAPAPRVGIDAVHLLSVTQYPDTGIFAWDTLAVIPLTG